MTSLANWEFDPEQYCLRRLEEAAADGELQQFADWRGLSYEDAIDAFIEKEWAPTRRSARSTRQRTAS